MTLTIPHVIGHRGAAAHAPENTLAGFRRAKALGCGMVEFDVKLTRNRVPILMHDDTLERTTNGQGAVMNADFAAIRTLDAGRYFSPDFTGERIPTLEEALKLALELDLAVNIEIKPCPGRDVETAQVALAQALAIWPRDREPPLVSSFSVDSLAAAKEAAPDWPRGYLIWDRPPTWRALADTLGAATLNIAAEKETPATIAEYRATGRPVLAYTINDAAQAKALFAQGIVAVFSDRPDAILAG
jgi:glycerophosphoryl diester phosphodiesterase